MFLESTFAQNIWQSQTLTVFPFSILSLELGPDSFEKSSFVKKRFLNRRGGISESTITANQILNICSNVRVNCI